MTTYRVSCGSHLGMRLHQEFAEEPCGQCLIGEAGRRLYSELIPTRPTPPPTFGEIAAEEMAEGIRNARLLAEALGSPHLEVVA